MLKKNLIQKNPLRLMGDKNDRILPAGGFGAVLARAGVGKTSLAVQLALHTLLQGRNVLHISLSDPVGKVTLWYEEVFRNVCESHDAGEVNRLWESVLTQRFIMTFQVEGFSAPKLEERITDLTEQGIFFPQMVLIDGLPFDEQVTGTLDELKTLAVKMGMRIWFTVKTHRHEAPGPEGFPAQLPGLSDLFDIVIALNPEDQEIQLKILKGSTPKAAGVNLVLDPSTLLIRDRG